MTLLPTRCAICGTEGNAAELYPATVARAALDATIFSARRPPDDIHWRMVRCLACGLVRADPVLPADQLARFYAESVFDEQEVPAVRFTYRRALAELDAHGARRSALLEIGAGSGFALEEARALGYRRTVGVEPSAQAAARAAVKPGIEMVNDVMRAGLFAAESFDVVCLFQTLDHLPDPAAVLDEAWRVLRPGGLILAFNHDVGSLSARIMGERSPIIDVEHTYLFDASTMRRLFASRGFDVLAVGPARNLVSLRYLVHLLPLRGRMRRAARTLVGASRLGGARLWLPLGNLRIIGRRAADQA